MTDTLYNLKLTQKEINMIRSSLGVNLYTIYDDMDSREAMKPDEDEEKAIKLCESIEERLAKGDYTKICWGRKANQQLKNKITKIEAENKDMKERLEYLKDNYKTMKERLEDQIELTKATKASLDATQ